MPLNMILGRVQVLVLFKFQSEKWRIARIRDNELWHTGGYIFDISKTLLHLDLPPRVPPHPSIELFALLPRNLSKKAASNHLWLTHATSGRPPSSFELRAYMRCGGLKLSLEHHVSDHPGGLSLRPDFWDLVLLAFTTPVVHFLSLCPRLTSSILHHFICFDVKGLRAIQHLAPNIDSTVFEPLTRTPNVLSQFQYFRTYVHSELVTGC
ncbi:uncharacterized protein CLUP02_16138 [Colletotrichum lupini]|uniref:Uncharacterized protein n=1 Tax=Colletotrichum lupini TaxID=145971 RepID=A0A9Q8WNX6_9PEZI|nr:uncharacterized protein CLUP02_16138 [Colletotrichum lupini]UQC90608.1 hypothetical protein CLUP02_16138 [Colletotrichum lupini]